MTNIIPVVPPVEVTAALLDLLRRWKKLAPSECRIQAEWDGGFAVKVGYKLIHVCKEITQSEYDYLFGRVLDAIANLCKKQEFYFTFQIEQSYQTARILDGQQKEIFGSDHCETCRLTASLDAYVTTLEAQGEAA